MSARFRPSSRQGRIDPRKTETASQFEWLGIVPDGPDLSGWLTPHGREALGGRPFGDGTPPGPVRAGEEVPNPLV